MYNLTFSHVFMFEKIGIEEIVRKFIEKNIILSFPVV